MNHVATAVTNALTTLYAECPQNLMMSGQYDVNADGYVRGYAIPTLIARLIEASTNSLIHSSPLTAVTANKWSVSMVGLSLTPSARYVLEIAVASTLTPLDHAAIIPS